MLNTLLFSQVISEKPCNMSVWIPAITALAGVVVSGIIGYFLNRQRLKHEDKKHRITKLEETFKEAYSHYLSANTAFLEFAMAIPVPDNDARVVASLNTYAALIKTNGPILKMLVDFYFPELNPKYLSLSEAESLFLKRLTEGINDYMFPGVEKACVSLKRDIVNAEMKKITEATESLQQGCTAIGKNRGYL